MGAVVVTLLGGLFGLMLLGLPLGFAIAAVSALVLKYQAGLPLWMFVQRFFVGLDSFVLVAIPFFILTGNLMNKAGITDRLIQLSYALVGHIRGGLAHINVLVSMLFAGVSGSAVADTAGVGSVLIPAMIKRGYSKSFTVAVTAASSTLGQIIPPSIIAIIYAATAGISVGTLFLAGAVPGVLIGFAQMLLSYIYAIKYGYPAEKRANPKEILGAFKDALLPLGIPMIIIGGVVFGIFTATEASVVAVLYSLILGLFVYRTIKPRELPGLLLETAKMSALSLFCIGGASTFGWLLGYFQASSHVTEVISGVTASPFVFLLLVIALFTILGTFMDAVPAIIIFVPVIQPIADQLGVHPIVLGVTVVVTLAFGLVTPPYGLCLMLASSIADITVPQALREVLIFLGVITLVLVLIVVYPDVILFLPRLLTPVAVGP